MYCYFYLEQRYMYPFIKFDSHCQNSFELHFLTLGKFLVNFLVARVTSMKNLLSSYHSYHFYNSSSMYILMQYQKMSDSIFLKLCLIAYILHVPQHVYINPLVIVFISFSDILSCQTTNRQYQMTPKCMVHNYIPVYCLLVTHGCEMLAKLYMYQLSNS